MRPRAQAAVDVFLSISPWVTFSLIATGLFCLLRETSAYETWVARRFRDAAVLTTVNSMLAFLSIGAAGVVLGTNKNILHSYAAACDACVLLALYTRRTASPHVSLILQSIPIAIREEYRSRKNDGPGRLPLAENALLNERFNRARSIDLSQTRSCLHLLCQDTLDVHPTHEAVFRQIETITGSYSSIAGTFAYSLPMAYSSTQTVLFALFFALEAAVNQVPKNGWFSLFTVPLMVTAYTALPEIARRYKNPFDRTDGEAPVLRISREACRSIRAVFPTDPSPPHVGLICKR